MDAANTPLQHQLSMLMHEKKIKSGSSLARELGVPAPTINRLLAGHVTDPRCSTLMLIADYFDVSLDFLVGRHRKFKT